MSLVRYDPFREFDVLSDRFNRMLGSSLMKENGLSPSAFGDWAPAIDVEETPQEYIMKADLPALKREDVKIGVEDGVLTMEGERKQEKEEKNKTFHRIERSYGKFVRRLALPSDVEQQKISADFKDGVLQVHMPKSATAKPKTVEIKIM